MHPRPCLKESPIGRCDHPWCRTPMLVTCLVGQTHASMVKTKGWIFADETFCCCHDYLFALRNVILVEIQHGNINTKIWCRLQQLMTNLIMFWQIGGHVVLEERDNPSIFAKFSSTFTLQEGRLCPIFNAKSLMYPLFCVCGKTIVLRVCILIKSINNDKNIVKMSLCEWTLTIFY